MYYFFCSLSFWGPESKEAARALTGQESQDFNSDNNLCSSYRKAVCWWGSLAYSRAVLANKAGSGYLLVSQLVCLP